MTLRSLIRPQSDEPVIEAYAYVDISHDLVAWAAYRGLIVSAASAAHETASNGFISLMMAKAIENEGYWKRELIMEGGRAVFAPSAPSRMRCLFAFADKASAESALAWGPAFRTENFSEVEVHPRVALFKADANWIPSPAAVDIADLGWLRGYWSGAPQPGMTPVWELLIDGTLVLCGTAIREAAMGKIARRFPDSRALAELSRVGAIVGSNLGAVSPFLLRSDTSAKLTFVIDAADLEDGAFMSAVDEHLRSSEPINWEWLRTAPLSETALFRLPDLTRYEKNLGRPWWSNPEAVAALLPD